MPEHDGLMRIFWPLDLSKFVSPGIIVGWRNSGLDIFIVSILEDVDTQTVRDSLKAGALIRNASYPVTRIFELCGKSSMQVLGVFNSPNAEIENLQIHAFTKPKLKLPQVYCARASTIQIIMFERPLPNRMQYISLDPISLALGDQADMQNKAATLVDADDERERMKNWRKSKELVEKLKLHTVVKHPASSKERALLNIVNQINCSWELNGVLAEAFLVVLEWRVKPDYAALKDISATAQQVDIRLQQFCYWPMQYVMLRKRKYDWESVTTSHPDYIRFYNSLWLVANDVIIGIALGSYIIENSAWVTENISRILSLYSIAALQNTISWLMDWPAGLKLNNELAAFLGDLFLWVIDYWSSCFGALKPVLPKIIWIVGFSSFAGASLPISLFSDFISVLTFHIYCFYMASARIYNWQYSILLSLFQLFRGKKHNVLRKRIDSCDYDLDQLLLGTILFTLLFFLLPTVLVFYITFASFRMAIITLKATLDALLACLNHFPLFALMLRVKDSKRLPGGICFELQDTESMFHNISKEIKLTDSSPSVPLKFRGMFQQYFQLGHRIRKHYLSLRVLLCLVTGRFVPSIHRRNLYSLQYTMLPARRAGILEMWTVLTKSEPQKKSHNGHDGKLNGRRMNGHGKRT
ncbi:hypothetical protein EPUL_000651 [Erysiphe pulchra]|uniref:Gpi1-domain-containing protein n=1 Tax=Erysiphe pulchra TaxID=225359 RepID=A0A2S4Q0C9_9PEZI|nr:hypothetical protein EPUL_000651 [Erysiphe pulchra]